MKIDKSQKDPHFDEQVKNKGTGKAAAQLNEEFKKMSYSKMLFTGLGNLVLLVICFWIHWSLGALYAIFWLFVLPYLDLKRLRKYEAKNPPVLPKSDTFDDSPLFEDEISKEDGEEDRWKSWDDWDEWKKPKE